jgi:hypothetical protein
MIGEMIWNAQTLGVVLGCGIPLAAIIGGIWLVALRTRSLNDLKREMVQRGMSADEIERVLAADGSSPQRRG